MKVCTDACLFGAWTANLIYQAQETGLKNDATNVVLESANAGLNTTNGSRVLDIGAGTGLLSLLVAQKTNLCIDAIELDTMAAEQARENAAASKWRDHIQVLTGDIRTIVLGRKYEWIISNPPFFENDLKSTDNQRNLALHSAALRLEELLPAVKNHLAEGGKFAVLLPFHRKESMEKLAENMGLFSLHTCLVKQTPKHAYFRVMFVFSAGAGIETHTNELTIQDGGKYTEAFSELLRPFYLKL